MSSKSDLNLNLLQWSAESGDLPIVGIDEAGRGCLCGPVFAAAVCFKNTEIKKKYLYKDSKLLSPEKRDKFYDEIFESHWVGVGSASSTEVDQINILQATFLAMRRAIDQLIKNYKDHNDALADELLGHVIVDGNQKIPGLKSFSQSTQIKGDQLVSEISAASIVAKVSRDRYVDQLGLKYPEYEFSKHKGYGTALHKEKIEQFGPCPEHRITFKGVREFIHIKSKQSYQGTVV